MKKILASFGWLALLIPFISVASAKTVFTAVRPVADDTETRQVSGFQGIASSGSFKVLVNIGSQESLKLEGDSEVLSRIETKVEKGILVIRTKGSFNWKNWNSGKVTVYITAKTLKSITCSGSGSVEVADRLKTNELHTTVSGSGSVRLNVDTQDYTAVVSGSGSITVSGSANETSLVVSGSGGFKGKDFSTSTASIKVSGSGSAYIAADKSLDAILSGSGSVRYSGNPQVNVTKSGSGRVTKI